VPFAGEYTEGMKTKDSIAYMEAQLKREQWEKEEAQDIQEYILLATGGTVNSNTEFTKQANSRIPNVRNLNGSLIVRVPKGSWNVELLNLNGRLIEKISAAGKKRIRIHSGSYPKGVYIVKLVGNSSKTSSSNKTNAQTGETTQLNQLIWVNVKDPRQ